MEEYRKGAHTVYDIKYHIVWITKYRYHVLKGEIAYRVRELIRQTCLAYDVHILKGHVSKDHIHLYVSAPPTISPSRLIQGLKGRSSRKLQMEFPQLGKRYWGKHMWGRGYFCASAGDVTDAMIRAYIEGQEMHHKDSDFKIDDEES
jgi:putative transposase